MKKAIFIFLFFVCALLCSCGQQKENKISLTENLISGKDSIANFDSVQIKQIVNDYDLNRTDTFDVGDVNGDGKKDKAIVQPLTFFFRNGKTDSQYVNITFTCNLPPVKHYDGFKGMVANAGDLDGNKTDEIIYYPDWYQSNSGGIYVYGYTQNKWTLLGSGSIRRESVEEAKDPIKFLKSRIKKINNKSFLITEKIWVDDKTIDSAKTISIK